MKYYRYNLQIFRVDMNGRKIRDVQIFDRRLEKWRVCYPFQKDAIIRAIRDTSAKEIPEEDLFTELL